MLEGALGELRALIEQLEGCERLGDTLDELRGVAQRLETGERVVLELTPAQARLAEELPALVQALVRRGLPPREAQLAALSYQGRSDEQIAEALHLGAHTVRWHWRKLYRRLNIHTRAAALRFVAEVLRGGSGVWALGSGLLYARCGQGHHRSSRGAGNKKPAPSECGSGVLMGCPTGFDAPLTTSSPAALRRADRSLYGAG